MDVFNFFKRAQVKPSDEESLPSITLVINRIEELQARKPVYEQLKIIKATIDLANHVGTVEFLRNNIRLWNDDHYFQASHQTMPGMYKIKETDEATGKITKSKKPVSVHTFNFDYYVKVPLQGITGSSELDEHAPVIKEKHTLLSAVLTLYVSNGHGNKD